MVMHRIRSFCLPSLDDRKDQNSRGREGKCLGDKPGVWVSYHNNFYSPDCYRDACSISYPYSSQTTIVHFTYGGIVLMAAVNSSQSTGGACIVSALTLLHWQSPFWKQEKGGEIRRVQSLWQKVWFPYMHLPQLTVQSWVTQSACLSSVMW